MKSSAKHDILTQTKKGRNSLLKRYAIGKRAVCAAAALAVGGVLLGFGAMRGRTLLRTAFDGRHLEHAEEEVSRFDLWAETARQQTRPRVSGWLTVVQPQSAAVQTDRGMLRGTVYPPLGDAQDAPWVILFHGGPGTDSCQVEDVACELSLAGYRVLTPDLFAHGASDGELTAFGAADAQDVRAWVDWVRGETQNARVALMGVDEGALAVLMAASEGLPENVRAIAADSPVPTVMSRAEAVLAGEGEMLSALDRLLMRAAYRVSFGEMLADVPVSRLDAGGKPLLLLAGTLDEQSPAYLAEDIARTAGERARVELIEGASHGMARYMDAQRYYAALLAFLKEEV